MSFVSLEIFHAFDELGGSGSSANFWVKVYTGWPRITVTDMFDEEFDDFPKRHALRMRYPSTI